MFFRLTFQVKSPYKEGLACGLYDKSFRKRKGTLAMTDGTAERAEGVEFVFDGALEDETGGMMTLPLMLD